MGAIERMQIRLQQLVLALTRLVEGYQQLGIDVLTIDDMDRYWVVRSPEWTEFHQEPKLSVGSLLEDWAGLQRVLQGGTPTAVGFERLGAVIRVVSDRILEPSTSTPGASNSVRIDIHLRQLPLLLTRLVENFQQAGVSALEIDDMDYYWVVEPPEWTDFQKEPSLCVGSLIDDWAELQRVLEGGIVTTVDFNRLGAMLRAVSERLGRQ
ncbi:hypothetical protein [Archangium lipolyticum]|uniref:hypothetical protein n=1 Tax=Archangium lipolyticum TaxID=2970465 RepID=UPI00214B697F|nr:hypothetical protein [Archangium lipolyticum]